MIEWNVTHVFSIVTTVLGVTGVQSRDNSSETLCSIRSCLSKVLSGLDLLVQPEVAHQVTNHLQVASRVSAGLERQKIFTP